MILAEWRFLSEGCTVEVELSLSDWLLGFLLLELLYPNPSHCSHCPNPDRHPLWLDRDLYRGEPVLVDEIAVANTWNISDLVSGLSWLQS